MQNDMKELVENWQVFIETIGLPAFIADKDLKLLVANASLLELVGQEKNEDFVDNIYMSFSPASRQPHAELDRGLLQDAQSVSLQCEIIDRDKSLLPVKCEKTAVMDSRGTPVAVLNLLVDQSELQFVERSFQRCESQRLALFENIPALLAQFNQDYELGWANEQFKQFTSGDNSDRLLPLFLRNEVSCPARDVLTAALSGAQTTAIQQLGDAELFFEVSGIPLELDGGKQALIICQNVTEKFKLEKQLRHSQKMEAIGTLAGGIAHDFNNVLTPIMGYSEILRFKSKQFSEKDAEFDEYVSEILKASRRAKGLVEQILTFSRSSEQKECMQYVHPIVKEVMKLMRVTLPSSIKIIEEIDENCGMVVVDPVLIHQVLINLCTNSAHALDGEQGSITVRLAPCEKRFDDKHWLELSVADTGAGMEPGVIDRIFEPYFTTKEKERGTGMGLAMVHGIIERQGGRIEVESKHGEGTIFTTYLPVAEGNNTTFEQVVQLDEFSKGEGKKILLVDDDPQVVRVTGDVLISLGYDVTGCTSPFEALTVFEQAEKGSFSVIITDLTMPGMNGVELAKKIRTIQPSVPVVLISGYSEQFSKYSAQDAGIVAYCIKPLSLRELSSVVRLALNPAEQQGAGAQSLGHDAFLRVQ